MSITSEMKLVKCLAAQLIEPIKKYRKARNIECSDKPQKAKMLREKFLESSYSWGLVIESKIEVIAVTGGIQLVKKVYSPTISFVRANPLSSSAAILAKLTGLIQPAE